MSLKFADNIAFYETGDGSNTLINKKTNETYHSKHGAVQESQHVFIKMGLEFVLSKGHRPIKILEVGFGTGLNAMLTADYHCMDPFVYHALEPFLVPLEIIKDTNYTKYLNQKHLKDYLVEQYRKQAEQGLNPMTIYMGNCEVKLFNTSIENFETDMQYDLIYYDAFSRHSQQEMWEGETIQKVVSLLKPGGVFVTYSVTGNLKRAMKEMGLEVERMAGAPGKREMLRAIKPME
jgi:tRNA U34 5-methylaminomethyl-2-thiouridine-forming methyltransferase MnmC